jgi:hypothetical protein
MMCAPFARNWRYQATPADALERCNEHSVVILSPLGHDVAASSTAMPNRPARVPVFDQMRNGPVQRPGQRLIKDRLEDRLSIRRETLIGIPGWNVVRPTDGDGIIGGKCCADAGAGAGRARRQHLQHGPALELECHDMLPPCSWGPRDLAWRAGTSPD